MEPIIFVKYGKESHLQQIVNGTIRFSPSQEYITLEETQHNKGQGDLLEGKLKIRFENLKLYDPKTNVLSCEVTTPCNVLLSIENVNNMPVFCLSQYGENDITLQGDRTIIHIAPEKIEQIKADFSEATHALIIANPHRFIQDVQSISEHSIVSDEIHYYDYDYNSMEMLMFLTTGKEEIDINAEKLMLSENKYRHLLCKDISFSKQQEYRFICTDTLITKPTFYTFDFSSKYCIVPIDRLFSSYEI